MTVINNRGRKGCYNNRVSQFGSVFVGASLIALRDAGLGAR
jgi:hypothetical protein